MNCREAAREAGLGHYTGEAYAAAGLLIGIAFLEPRAQPAVSGFNKKKLFPFGKSFLLVKLKLCVANLVDVTGQVQHLAGEAPLVVVPSHELNEVIVQCQACVDVEDGGVRIGAKSGENGNT